MVDWPEGLIWEGTNSTSDHLWFKELQLNGFGPAGRFRDAAARSVEGSIRPLRLAVGMSVQKSELEIWSNDHSQ